MCMHTNVSVMGCLRAPFYINYIHRHRHTQANLFYSIIRCVYDLELVGGMYLKVQLQFQMDRLAFCRMHFAVDQLVNTDVVFPDVSRIDANWNEKHVFKIRLPLCRS